MRTGWAIILFGALVLLLAGCASDGPPAAQEGRSGQPSQDQAAAPAEGDGEGDALARAALPDVELAPPDGDGAAQGGEQPRDERFDISARDLPVREVLLSLVDGTPFSVVIHPQVQGQITLDLQEVTVPETLRFLGHSYGYGITRSGNRFFVEPASMRTRMFRVNYLDVVREGSSSTEVSSGQVSQTVQGEGGGQQGGGAKGSTLSTQSKTDFWAQIRQGLSTILGPNVAGGSGGGGSEGEGSDPSGGGERPRLVIHSDSGVVLVRARPDKLGDVADYLEAVEGSSHRQVIIEAKVLEVQLEESQQAGINWAALGQSGDARVMGSQISPELRANNLPNSALGSDSATQAFGELTSGSTGGGFAAAVGAENFAGLLNLLETQGDVNVLSSPRVATVNNQKAVIKVGVDEFFLTNISLQSNTTTAGQTQNYDVELTPFFSGIALDVTPQISGEGMVTLHVHPSVTDVTSSNKEIRLSDTESMRLPLARSDVRESDSIVRAEDGEVVVIGGLMKETSQTTTSGIPYLSRIPVLGWLFGSRSQEQVKRELVILLRPRVVYGEEPEREETLKDMWENGIGQDGGG